VSGVGSVRKTGRGDMTEQSVIPYTHPNRAFGVLRGPVHEVRAEAARLEQRGKIRVLGQGVVYRDAGRSLIAIPYVPLTKRTPAQRRSLRDRMLIWSGYGVIGLGTLTALLAALWHVRYIALAGVGLVLLPTAIVWLYRLFVTGHACKGLHCADCPSHKG